MSPILFNIFVNDINEIFDVRFGHLVSLGNIKLSNLLYADDLILISKTKTGLQSCLDNLQAYCQKWKLMVNNKKTKAMVVEKRPSSAQIHRFNFKKEPLEICKLYPYLRTIIANNGNFKANIEELCKSARRAMYTLLGSTNKFASGNLRVLLKLFDRMILPICTYNCEVWGSTFFTRKFVPSDFLSERQLKNAVDKVNCVFIKQILRVNSKASNWAVLSETNRSSLIPGIMPRMISFWKHLQDSPSPIIEQTVKLSKTLHEQNHYSWFTGLSKVAEVLGETNDFLASTVQRKLALRRILESH